MTTNHIDQLTEWWSEAEHAPFRQGDVLIARFDDRPMPFEIYPAGCDSDAPAENVRILTRAPKPKPAWHDALAVMARCSSAPEGHREPFIRSEATRNVWIGEGGWARTEDLRDVTPLIEAKVTDEMVERGAQASTPAGVRYLSPSEVREVLVAALGLETQ